MTPACIGGLALWTLSWSSAPQADDDAAGERGRAELAALVKRARDACDEPRTVELEAKERAFALAFGAVEAAGVRVLATSGEEEARSVARHMAAARALFAELFAVEASFPAGCSAYLLSSPEARDAFLTRHPAITPQVRERLARREGSGVEGSADWAWWQGDTEKRLDGLVRFSFDWFFQRCGVTSERHPWLHEGLGFYLTHALVGTYLTWFEPPRTGGVDEDARNIALEGRMRDPGADWLALARGLFAAEERFDLEELMHLEPAELGPSDYLRAHALAAYLVEVQRAALPAVLQRVGAREDPRTVLEESLGFALGELRVRLDAWLERREALVARAEGRRSEAELLALWKRAGVLQRRTALAGFRARLAELDTAQLRWLRAAAALAPPELARAAELPFFDPKVHAPAQPIARKRLTSGDGRVKKVLKELPEPRAGAREVVLALDYDWGRDVIVRLSDLDEPETVFRNALLGVPPGADLARALALQALDREEERKLQAAFEHAYTDREGNVYPVTLFRMWATGKTMEMPDVDTLGIVHDVLGEWRRWVAPVPPAQHDALYKVIGELFLACRHARELRAALADVWLFPEATPREGYESQALNLHALWATQESDPAKLAAVLPDAKQWKAFLDGLIERCKQDPQIYTRGKHRAHQLRKDGEAVRSALGAALDEALAAPTDGEPSDGR